MSATRKPGRVFAAAVMPWVADGSMRIVRLIGMKMIERLLPVLGQGPVVPMMGIVPVIYVAVEPTVSMVPRAGADKDPANEPVGSVEPVGRAVVGCVVEVTIGTNRRGANVDGNLCGRA